MSKNHSNRNRPRHTSGRQRSTTLGHTARHPRHRWRVVLAGRATLLLLVLAALGAASPGPAHADPGPCGGTCVTSPKPPPPPNDPRRCADCNSGATKPNQRYVTVYRKTRAYSTPYLNALKSKPLPAAIYPATCEANSGSRGRYSNPWWSRLRDGYWINNGDLNGRAKTGIGDCAAVPPNDAVRRPARHSKEYTTAMALGFGPRPRGAAQHIFDSGVKTADDGVIVTKFFIPNRRAALGFLHGDNRSWSKDPATARRSRVYVTWDVATGKVSVIVNETTTLRGVTRDALRIRQKSQCRDVQSADIEWRTKNDFYVGAADNGLLLCMSALNSITGPTIVGAMSVDGALSIQPNGAGGRAGLGGYRVAFNGNGYPATEIYYYPRTSSAVRTLFLRRIDPSYVGLRPCLGPLGRPQLCDPSGGFAALDSNSYWWCFNGNQADIHQKSICSFDSIRSGSDRAGARFDTNDGDRPG